MYYIEIPINGKQAKMKKNSKRVEIEVGMFLCTLTLILTKSAKIQDEDLIDIFQQIPELLTYLTQNHIIPRSRDNKNVKQYRKYLGKKIEGIAKLLLRRTDPAPSTDL
jgi:hypothetical protein